MIEPQDNYVRYASRHTAHWNCFFGEDTPTEAAMRLSRLPDHMQKKVPWKIAERLGLDHIISAAYRR
jgi:hypothetical protein